MNAELLNDIGIRLIYLEVTEDRGPLAEEVVRWLRLELEGRRARNVGRFVAGKLGDVLRSDLTPYQNALALGITKEDFIGWLRDKTAAICADL